MSAGTHGATRSGRWRSREQFQVLHAVRLAGFADDRGVFERVEIAASQVASVLDLLEGQGLVQQFTFAGSSGWVLTDSGRLRDAELLLEDLEGSGARAVLERTVVDFDSLNAHLVRVITEWQLRSLGTEGNSAESAGLLPAAHQVVQELTAIQPSLVDLMAALVARLPRFGRYPKQSSHALLRARQGDLRWIAGVGLLSYHAVWAELHQDLLSSLALDRSPTPGQGGA